METDKSQVQQAANWRPRRDADGIVLVPDQRPETQES